VGIEVGVAHLGLTVIIVVKKIEYFWLALSFLALSLLTNLKLNIFSIKCGGTSTFTCLVFLRFYILHFTFLSKGSFLFDSGEKVSKSIRKQYKTIPWKDKINLGC